MSAWVMSAWVMSAWVMSAWVMSAWVMSAWVSSDYISVLRASLPLDAPASRAGRPRMSSGQSHSGSPVLSYAGEPSTVAAA